MVESKENPTVHSLAIRVVDFLFNLGIAKASNISALSQNSQFKLKMAKIPDIILII